MTGLFAFKEAVASVALEHPPDCDCLTCRAASGDQAAFMELLLAATRAEYLNDEKAK